MSKRQGQISMDAKIAIRMLKRESDSEVLKGMQRFGINTRNSGAVGVTIPKIRKLAKEIGKNHQLAFALWKSDMHEAKLLATMIDDPKLVTERQMDSWVKEFNSWDICDQCCSGLFDKTAFSYKKVFEWPKSGDEYVKRAGFALMAALAVHDKGRKDEDFIRLLPLIENASDDERNFVRKAVNWALRQIGKRNRRLNKYAIKSAERIRERGSKSARWIAADALRELKSEAVQRRLKG